MPPKAPTRNPPATRTRPKVSSAKPSEPIYFESPAEMRGWLQKHHASESELFVGYHKRDTGTPSITWPQSVDQALCFGWIDGVRKSIDGKRYLIRFTPRKATSVWSAVNLKRFAELKRDGLVFPAGDAAFAARSSSRGYSYESRSEAALTAEQERTLRANPKAWEFFSSRPPSWKKAAIWWLASAKKPETQVKRLEQLVECSAAGRTVPPLTPRPGKK